MINKVNKSLYRGGRSNNVANVGAGVFSFYASDGGAYYVISTRAVLVGFPQNN